MGNTPSTKLSWKGFSVNSQQLNLHGTGNHQSVTSNAMVSIFGDNSQVTITGNNNNFHLHGSGIELHVTGTGNTFSGTNLTSARVYINGVQRSISPSAPPLVITNTAPPATAIGQYRAGSLGEAVSSTMDDLGQSLQTLEDAVAKVDWDRVEEGINQIVRELKRAFKEGDDDEDSKDEPDNKRQRSD